VAEVRMVQHIEELASHLERIALLDEELLAELRVDIEVAGSAENARAGITEIPLYRCRNARGRTVGLKHAGGVARRSAGAVNRGADRGDGGGGDHGGKECL